MKRARLSALLLPFFLAAACAVGPDYKRPQVEVPKQWTVAPARGTSTGPPRSGDWWSSFEDPQLDSLIDRAVERNLDLKLALERVQEARAATGVARAGVFPSVDAGASATRIRGGINQGVTRAVPSSADPEARPSLVSPFETSVFQGSLGASWELDVFGRIRRGVQAAGADATAAEENRRDVLVILLGDVGRVYAQLRGYQRRLEIADRNIGVQRETLDLTIARASAGLATELDVSRAAAQLESTKAAVPSLRTGIDVSIHRLSVLVGEEPGALRGELEEAKPIPSAAPDVEIGLPSALLQRRPDIRRAEAQLAAATARIGEAKADLFPRFTLTGTAGRQATQLQDLTLGAGNFFSFGPGIRIPLFTGGRIRSNIDVQTSRRDAARIRYRSAILNALEEVQDALVAYSQEQERRDRLNDAVRHSRLAVDLSAEQYKAGLVDFLAVLDAQRNLYAEEDRLAGSETEVVTDLIALYRALGGGWAAEPPIFRSGRLPAVLSPDPERERADDASRGNLQQDNVELVAPARHDEQVSPFESPQGGVHHSFR
ncbi:MAG: efflux transporter outer membrane subunit [Deltaproteobacteria bacterium]|nr:efflux transporter outer membrane subunit [Deltaproteobacteria bacterium]PWB65766.1 MAG: RND transporter [Deltaproteobacteria bacterium]